jgi:hypothetical protein
MQTTTPTGPPPVKDWPLWWFSKLEAALKRGNHHEARQAIRQLERLGIEVRFTLPPPVTGEVCRAT